MEFIETHHLTGVLTGLSTFLIIGIFHPIVIKSEYYWGTRCWIFFLLAGLAALAGALVVEDVFWSSLLGVSGFSSFWSILEIFEQKERVRKGWFPMNPKRKDDYADKRKK